MNAHLLITTTVASSGAGLAIFGILALLILAAGVVTAMKGHWLWFVVGIFVGIGWIIGAFLPAKPGSAWARRQSA